MAKPAGTRWPAAGAYRYRAERGRARSGAPAGGAARESARDRGLDERPGAPRGRPGEIVATALRLATPQVDRELRERHFGVFEGADRDECQTQHPEAWRDWVAKVGVPPAARPGRMQRSAWRAPCGGSRAPTAVRCWWSRTAG